MLSLGDAELFGVLKKTMDTVWLISAKEYKVRVLGDTMMPWTVGKIYDYRELYNNYVNYVYSADLNKWKEMMSIEALAQMCKTDMRERVCEMRFQNESSGFEWHQAFLNVVENENGDPDRILITSRNINEIKKAEIVTRAVETEYDFIAYIDANANSYVMYSSNKESGTPVPPASGDDYEKAVAEFHRTFIQEELRDTLTQQLSIRHVQPILEEAGEYVIYCTVTEYGKYRDKKLRFSYFNKDKNIWLLTRSDITEIREEKRQKQLLKDALDAATAANQAKSEFLSRMSHDIRTPMNAIIGMTAIAGAHMNEPERIADCLAKITSSSRLLLGLINEVLDMSKVESGSIVLAEEKIDLADLVRDVVNMVQPVINSKKQYFEAHIRDVHNEMVIGDSQRLQQVLMNILSNAAKYTEEGGHILLEIREKPSGRRETGCYEFSVSDDGIGMKPDFLEKIFEPFERSPDEAVQKTVGTGLGMAISKNIVEMMGGEIAVESAYGEGSRVTATMCLRLQKQREWDVSSLAGRPVLVVDDDEVVCRDVTGKLNELGMEAYFTRTGEKAVSLVKEAHIHGKDYFAVIIDLRMPGMDGIETTRRIRASVGCEIPIIMISAYDWSEYEDAAIEAGVNGFIVKPLFQSRLIYKLKQFVSGEKEELKQNNISLPEGQFEGKRVLLAEDNEINREIAVELLSSVQLETETAENGRIAVEMVKNSPEFYYDLVFMDMQMPVMDGCEATKNIRKLNRKDVKSLPIVAMTANAFAEDIDRAQQAGMNEHLAKPINMELLSQSLSRWLSGNRFSERGKDTFL